MPGAARAEGGVAAWPKLLELAVDRATGVMEIMAAAGAAAVTLTATAATGDLVGAADPHRFSRGVPAATAGTAVSAAVVVVVKGESPAGQARAASSRSRSMASLPIFPDSTAAGAIIHLAAGGELWAEQSSTTAAPSTFKIVRSTAIS